MVAQGVEALLPLAGLFDAAKETERLNKQAGRWARGCERHIDV